MQQAPTTSELDKFKVDNNMTEHCKEGVSLHHRNVVGSEVSVDHVVRGCLLDLDHLPPTTPSSIRLNLTLTNDFSVLKRTLEEEEFPKLRKYCEQQYGVEFQVLTEPEAWLLPWKIDKETFENLLQVLQENHEDSSTLSKWYRVDENSCRGHYACEEARNSFKNGVANDWKDAKLQIEALLQYGVQHAQHNDVKKELRRNLIPDVGKKLAFEPEKDKAGRRTELCKDTYSSIVEMNASVTVIDHGECQETSVNVVTKSGVRRFPIRDNQVLAVSVYDCLQQMIDETIQERESSDLMREIVRHWTVAKRLCTNFVGHRDTLQLIRQYIFGETFQLLVLIGASGAGKSTMIAQAAIFASQLLSNGDKRFQSTVMLRFCGHTYNGQGSRRLICSLAEQFLCATDRERPRFFSWHREARQLLGDVMRNGDYKGLLVVFLDAIDEIGSAEDLEDFLDWLPARLANNVKVIISCDSESRTLDRLKQKVTNHANIIPFGQLSIGNCVQLLNSLLEQSDRKLTTPQWTLVEHAFAHCHLPLYVHLLHDTVSCWTSFANVSEQALEATAEKCAVYKFKRLEDTHGRSLTSNALGYLVAELGGLTDCEMEDLLSLNDDVLKEISDAGGVNSVSRCSSVTWIRFRSELGSYLTVGDTGGLWVIRFAHRSLMHVAAARYAKSPSSKISLHSQIADYFMRTSSPGLPDTTTSDRRKRSEGNNIPEAPLFFSQGSERPNYRKLDLLPIHLHRSGRFNELFSLVYFNFYWIYAKLVARSTQELLTDFRMVKDAEAEMVAEALVLSEATLESKPHLLGVELTGRLLGYYAKYDRIRSLIDHCDRSAMILCPLVPLKTTFTVACSALQKIVSLSDVSCVTGFSVSENTGRLLLAQKSACDVRMRVWNVTSGERQADIVLTSGSDVFFSPDGKFGSVFKERSLRIYHLESGDQYAEIEYGTGAVNCTASSGKYFAFGFDQAPGPVVIDLDNAFLLRRFQYRSRSLAISHDQNYFVCNSSETLAIHELPLLERKATILLSAVAEKLVFSKEPGAVKVYAMTEDRSLQVVSFQMLKRTGNSQTLFQDFDLKDFKLSHGHNNLRILVRLSRSLYLLDGPKPQQKTPRKLRMDHSCLDTKQTFLDAGFSRDDRLIVAVRGAYVGLWDTSSAQLLRVLASSEEQIFRLYLLETVNAALTIGSDFCACLWNLDRLETEQQKSTSRIIRSEVRHIATAKLADRFICAGACDFMMAMGSVQSEEFEYFADPSVDYGVGSTTEFISISNSGAYAVTRISMTGQTDESGSHSLTQENLVVSQKTIVETEDVIWDLTDCCRPIYRVANSVDAGFSSDGLKVAFVVQRGKGFPEQNQSTSELIVFDLEKWKKAPDGKEFLVHIDIDNAAAKIVFVDGSSFIVCIHESSGKSNRSNQLAIYSFGKLWPGLRYISGLELVGDNRSIRGKSKNDINNNEDCNVILVNVHAVKDAVLLVTIELESFTPTTAQKPLQNTHNAQQRLAVLYDIRRSSVLSRIEPFLLPNSDAKSTIMLQDGTTFVDNRCNVFKLDNTCGNQRTLHVGRLDLDIRSGRDLCFVLGGRYAVAIVGEGKELVLKRTEDGQEKGRLETHCRATVLAVCSDDQTVLVGCDEGRVMAFTVVLEELDPVTSLLRKGPSGRRTKLTPDVSRRESGR